jgi:hypothetical protein
VRRSDAVRAVGNSALRDRAAGGFSFAAALPARILSDDLDNPFRSSTRLFEDHRELDPPHAPLTAIEELGAGRFSHWQNTLIFSTSDGSSALENGRRYRALIEFECSEEESSSPTLEGHALAQTNLARLILTTAIEESGVPSRPSISPSISSS